MSVDLHVTECLGCTKLSETWVITQWTIYNKDNIQYEYFAAELTVKIPEVQFVAYKMLIYMN